MILNRNNDDTYRIESPTQDKEFVVASKSRVVNFVYQWVTSIRDPVFDETITHSFFEVINRTNSSISQRMPGSRRSLDSFHPSCVRAILFLFLNFQVHCLYFLLVGPARSYNHARQSSGVKCMPCHHILLVASTVCSLVRHRYGKVALLCVLFKCLKSSFGPRERMRNMGASNVKAILYFIRRVRAGGT